jgi:hypothetical protein
MNKIMNAESQSMILLLLQASLFHFRGHSGYTGDILVLWNIDAKYNTHVVPVGSTRSLTRTHS